MPIIVCIFLGLIAGYIAHGFSKSTGNGVVLELGLGVAGAVIAGSHFSHIAAAGSTGFNTADALVAALAGVAALLATFHGLRDMRYRLRDPI